MAYDVRIIADSVSARQHRLTTIEVTLPRIVLAEFNTHRVFSRNSASSRAIPVEKMLKRVQEDPFIPVYWGKNQKGMQASEELSDEIDGYVALGNKPDPGHQGTSPRWRAQEQWLLARDNAVEVVKRLQMPDIDLHKQIANRLLEPWLWHTIIVSSTEWENYFALRTHKDAQPEIRRAAIMMKDAYDASEPQLLTDNMWHLPLAPDAYDLLSEGFSPDDIRLISVGRCARVSYLTHNGTREPSADIDLAKKLQAAGHMSPFEHVARPMTFDELHTLNPLISNFKGWLQYRKILPNEDNFMKTLAQRVG